MTTTQEYILHLADNALILSQRQSEWCGHGPILEHDIAITNISLDLLGQARNFYSHAAEIINQFNQNDEPKAPSLLGEGVGGGVTEDSLAYLRTEREFKNCLLVEQPNGDWGQTILKLYFFSQFQYLLFEQLQNSKDAQVAAIASKSIKETTYHVRWSGEWVIRLGDGTEESHIRMQQAVEELWSYTGELFLPTQYEIDAANNGIGVDVGLLKENWLQKITNTLEEATLSIPEKTFMQQGGKEGVHTEQMGYILTELQYLQRAYPNSEW
jgi:ring-1,2-phenylacetyl-CoA epoxidase subunit PaaC